MEPGNTYYLLGRRDAIANLFSDLRMFDGDLTKVSELFHKMAEEYQKVYEENPHIEWYLNHAKK